MKQSTDLGRFSHLLMVLVLFFSSTKTYAQSGQMQLRNAYEVAKWLAVAEASHMQDSSRQKLLGSLIWYANLQDARGDIYRTLFDRLWNYPTLSGITEQMSGKLLKYERVFDMDPDMVRGKINQHVPSLSVKNSFLTSYDMWVNQKKDLADFNRTSDAEIAEIKTKISQLNDEMITYRSKEVVKRKDLEDQLAVVTTVADSNLIKERLDTIAQSIERKQLKIDSTLQEYRKSIEAKEKMREFKESRVNSLRKYLLLLMLQQPDALRNFLFDISGISTDAQSFSLVIGNWFDRYVASSSNSVQQMITATESASKQSLRLPSEAEMINALAIYLANRIKQESVMWFFEKITQHAGRYELMKLFFPSTVRLLQGNEVYEIPNLGAQWQYALSKDFMQMPVNVLNSSWLKDRWPGAATYAPFITGTLQFAELISKRYSYRESIKTLYLSYTKDNQVSQGAAFQFRDYITILYAINTELFIPDSSSGYRMLAYEDLRSMSRKELEVMLSLLDLKYHGVFSKLIKGLYVKPGEASPAIDIEAVRRVLGNLQSVISRVEKAGSDYMLDQQSGKKDWFYSTYNVWGAIDQIFAVFNGEEGMVMGTPGNTAAIKKVFGYGGQVFEIYNLITKKNFAGAVLNTLSLIDTLLYESKDDHQFTVTLQKVQQLFASTYLKEALPKKLASAEWKKAMGVSYSSGNDTLSFTKNSPIAAVLFDQERHAIQLIRKLSGFLNDAALAQGDQQLAKVVESYAMPVGSYKRKRNNWWSVDLNAFAGPYVGYEWSRRQQNDATGGSVRKKGGVWGFSVPIGISVSKTFGRRWRSGSLPEDMVRNPDKVKLLKRNLYVRSGWTFTLTGSIVDLGAVVSYRLGNTPGDTTIQQSFKWSQLISPGIHLAVALPGSPFTVSTGLQYTPQLRKYEEAGKPNEQQFNTTRIYLGLMFDLPLFNFWERKHIVYRK